MTVLMVLSMLSFPYVVDDLVLVDVVSACLEL
jgi:hypothetical protein